MLYILVSAVRKTDIIQDRSNIKLSSVESPLANQNINNFAADATVTTMAKVDALPVCLPNHFIKTGNTGSEVSNIESTYDNPKAIGFRYLGLFRLSLLWGKEYYILHNNIALRRC